LLLESYGAINEQLLLISLYIYLSCGDCQKVIITSPVGAVAKYCDEYVCMCVSVYPQRSP